MANATTFEQHLTQQLPRALQFLEELVSLNSYTINAAGIEANAQRVIRQFEPFGFAVRRAQCPYEGAGQHLVLDSGGDAPVIALISHLDTVFSPEEEAANNFQWRPEGNRAYGPGTMDIKGGTVMIWMVLDALSKLEPELFKQTRWILLFNAAEEKLLPDFGALCKEVLPANTRACLVFEPDTEREENFRIVSARKGSGHFDVQVTGHSAHAGSKYAEGASAILQMSRLVEKMIALTDLSTDTTVNVGVMSGGTVRNSVPNSAQAEVEVRSFNEEPYREVRDAILAMNGPGDVQSPDGTKTCQVEITLATENVLWPQNEQTDALVALWQEAARESGHQLDARPRGGLSDGNALCRIFPTVDGLGPRGGNAHCSQHDPAVGKEAEFVDMASFVPKALINCLAVQKLLKPEGLGA